MTMNDDATALRPVNRHSKKFVLIFLGLVASAILLMWAWNTIAVDLLHAAPATFRHGFATIAALAASVATLRAIWTWGGGRVI